ncbi:hypothetical protein BUALT_Bualt18G0128100 [Buddleja alternifolia]|uniref:Uncharacterized protein n=1 Tax=Buddleja alternifolia TaxID=168488 RepID=A0AAV6WFD6_9LAMI|nr:hypothetical protein BUALT_Bualt18G0128100 [Buddleja alternifolia]
MNEGESSAAAAQRGRVQKDSSTSANVHAQSKVKSTTRVESVAPKVQRKSKSVGLRRNLQVHKEVSKNAVSSQLEIRAKDKVASTQQPTTLRNPALTKSVRMRRPTSLTRPAWVPPLSSMLNGVRFSTTKRSPQLSGKHVGTSAAEEQPPQCSKQWCIKFMDFC